MASDTLGISVAGLQYILMVKMSMFLLSLASQKTSAPLLALFPEWLLMPAVHRCSCSVQFLQKCRLWSTWSSQVIHSQGWHHSHWNDEMWCQAGQIPQWSKPLSFFVGRRLLLGHHCVAEEGGSSLLRKSQRHCLWGHPAKRQFILLLPWKAVRSHIRAYLSAAGQQNNSAYLLQGDWLKKTWIMYFETQLCIPYKSKRT